MISPGRRTPLALVAVYAAAGSLWAAFARWAVPPIIAAAYEGRSLPRLNALFRNRAASHPVEHYFSLWNSFARAILLAGCCHLAIVLVIRVRGNLRACLPLVLFAAAFLATTVLSGPRHDYTAFLEIWDRILAGGDPWWVHETWGYPLNAYGPLFNALAALRWANPLAPKLLFATAYLLFAIGILRTSDRPRLAWLALAANPYPWVEVALFGHFDVLVGLSCVAAVEASRRNKDATAGACLAAGILLKYLPAVLVPFFVVDRRTLHARAFASLAVVTAAGMFASWLVWGASTFRPLGLLATSRSSSLLSVFRFLRGTYSPLRLIWDRPDLDRFASPCLLAALPLVFAYCQIRRVGLPVSAILGLLTTLLLYRVGYPQYWMPLFLLAASWALRSPSPLAGRPLLTITLLAYFSWLGLFNLFYAAIDGIIQPAGPWLWVDDVAGLPTFLLGWILLVSLLRATQDSGHHGGREPLAE